MLSVLWRIVPVLPAALLLLFSEWSGTLWHGAQALPASLGWLALGALCLLARDGAADPLALGGRGRLALLVLAVAVVLSLAFSPVARAGMTGALVLPLLLLLPTAMAACWRSSGERSLGIAALAAVLAAVSVHAVVARFVMDLERASLPLGQHNLLALWLVLLLPCALVPALDEGWRRWLGVGAAAAALLALGLTGSLAGVLGWLVEVGVLLVALRRLLGERHSPAARLLVPGLVVVGLAGAALVGPRVLSVARGADSSAQARVAYLEAAFDGVAARPLLGWGPGSGSWLLAERLEPEPGVHPPYEVVTDAHSMWVDWTFELGVVGVGALVAALALFVARRREELKGLDPGPQAARRWASLAAVLGGGVCLSAAGTFDVAALAVAAAVPLALGLPGAEERSAAAAPATGSTPRPARWPLWLVAACLVALLPSRVAHWHFDRFLALGDRVARQADPAGAAADVARADRWRAAASRHLERAVRLDPAFPLYRFRLALEGEVESPIAELRSAAAAARGVGVLWLVAGARAGQAALPGFDRDLERACDLDPLGAVAPFVLAVLDPEAPAAPERLARALLAEPRLAAAARLEETDRLVGRALDRLAALDGLPPGWLEAVREEVATAEAADLGDDPEVADLRLELDALGSTSLSLYAFRRRPTLLPVLSIQVARERAARITAPGAFVLRETDRSVLAAGCRLSGAR